MPAVLRDDSKHSRSPSYRVVLKLPPLAQLSSCLLSTSRSVCETPTNLAKTCFYTIRPEKKGILGSERDQFFGSLGFTILKTLRTAFFFLVLALTLARSLTFLSQFAQVFTSPEPEEEDEKLFFYAFTNHAVGDTLVMLFVTENPSAQ